MFLWCPVTSFSSCWSCLHKADSYESKHIAFDIFISVKQIIRKCIIQKVEYFINKKVLLPLRRVGGKMVNDQRSYVRMHCFLLPAASWLVLSSLVHIYHEMLENPRQEWERTKWEEAKREKKYRESMYVPFPSLLISRYFSVAATLVDRPCFRTFFWSYFLRDRQCKFRGD